MRDDSMRDDNTIWIRTEPTPDGAGFVVNVEVSDDESFTLSPDDAFHHARVLLWACAYAEYDASVYRQMMARELEADVAYSLVRDLQSDRAPIDVGGTGPLTYLPALTKGERDPVH
jgi:hypothetical protein